jgi:chemotaxis protein MotB
MRWLALVVVLGAVGCVPKKKHNELVAEMQSKIDGQVSAMNEMSGELEDCNGKLEASNTQLTQANQQLASKMAEAGQLQQNVQTMQAALAEMNRQKALADQTMKQYQDLVAKFKQMIDAGTLKVKVIDGRMVVELATDILFPAGSATLSREGQKAIASVASVLASIADRQFQVSGHTDDQPIHTAQFPSNWDLGAARAISVVQLLTKSGLAPERVSAASYAEYQPADTNRTTEGRAANRRIEIVVVPDLSSLPGYGELSKLGTPGATPAPAPAPAPPPGPPSHIP